MFLDLRRGDLQDLFRNPEDFVVRKKLSDFIEDVVSTVRYN